MSWIFGGIGLVSSTMLALGCGWAFRPSAERLAVIHWEEGEPTFYHTGELNVYQKQEMMGKRYRHPELGFRLRTARTEEFARRYNQAVSDIVAKQGVPPIQRQYAITDDDAISLAWRLLIEARDIGELGEQLDIGELGEHIDVVIDQNKVRIITPSRLMGEDIDQSTPIEVWVPANKPNLRAIRIGSGILLFHEDGTLIVTAEEAPVARR